MPKVTPVTLGSVLNDARRRAGLSIRQLAEAADVPKTIIGRLLLDEVDRPSPTHLVRLAATLEVKASDLFLLAGVPLPAGSPSVEALLRTEYALPEAAVREAKAQIDAIVARYQHHVTTTKQVPKGGKHEN